MKYFGFIILTRSVSNIFVTLIFVYLQHSLLQPKAADVIAFSKKTDEKLQNEKLPSKESSLRGKIVSFSAGIMNRKSHSNNTVEIPPKIIISRGSKSNLNGESKLNRPNESKDDLQTNPPEDDYDDYESSTDHQKNAVLNPNDVSYSFTVVRFQISKLNGC